MCTTLNCESTTPADLKSPLAADVHDSTVLLAAQQVRIHTSMGNRLLLSVGSNPIIEHCSGLAFGPLLPAQQAALGLPAVAADGDNNRYANVQDFNWLRSTPSPNWCVLMSAGPDIASTSPLALSLPCVAWHDPEPTQLKYASQNPDRPSALP